MKDTSKLVKKKVMGRDGKPHVVWVDPHKKQGKKRQPKQQEVKVAREKKEEAPKQGNTPKLVMRMKEGVGKAAERAKEWKEKQQAMYSKDGGGEPETEAAQNLSTKDKAAAMLKGKARGILEGMKHEVKEWKSAAQGVKNFVEGKKMTDHEKHALKTVAIHLGIVVGMAAAGGGLAGGAGAAAKNIGLHFLEHAGMMRAAHALAFAKGEEEGDEPQSGLSDEELDEAMLHFIHEFSEYLMHKKD